MLGVERWINNINAEHTNKEFWDTVKQVIATSVVNPATGHGGLRRVDYF